MIATIFRPKRKRDGKTITNRLYRARYRLQDGGKIFDVPLHTTDKRVAQQKLQEIIKEQELLKAGLLPQKRERDAIQVLLVDHLRDFERDLQALNRDARHILQTRCSIERLIKECNWIYPADVNPDSFQAWRAKQVLSPSTINSYLIAIRSLLNWMERHERLVKNPLARVQQIECNGAVVRKRRAFSHDEIVKLIAAAPERKVVYLAAVHTGLRRGELSSLQWDNIHLDGPKPFVNVRASMTKNRKQAVIALHPDVVAELRILHAQPHEVTDFVLADLMPSMATFKDDLKKAGIAYLNAQGQFADFHALRYTLATNLARAGVAPRVAMEVMRHSDMHLTTKTYTDVGLLPTADVVDILPSFTTPQPSQIDSQQAFSDRQTESIADTESAKSNDSQVVDSTAIRHEETQLDNAGPQDGEMAPVRVRVRARARIVAREFCYSESRSECGSLAG